MGSRRDRHGEAEETGGMGSSRDSQGKQMKQAREGCITFKRHSTEIREVKIEGQKKTTEKSRGSPGKERKATEQQLAGCCGQHGAPNL
jgi:hypothetical protein